MKEALEKYLELAPTGQFADAAKALLQQIGATVQTNYTNPNAPKKTGTKKPQAEKRLKCIETGLLASRRRVSVV